MTTGSDPAAKSEMKSSKLLMKFGASARRFCKNSKYSKSNAIDSFVT